MHAQASSKAHRVLLGGALGLPEHLAHALLVVGAAVADDLLHPLLALLLGEVAVALLLRRHALLPPLPRRARRQGPLQLLSLGRAPRRVEPEPLGRAQVPPGLLQPLGGEQDVRQVEVRLGEVRVRLLRLAECLDRLGPPARGAQCAGCMCMQCACGVVCTECI